MSNESLAVDGAASSPANGGSEWPPRRLIEWFDSWFDVRLDHDTCLARLQEAGVSELSAPDPFLALVHYVGESWCRMIRSDVRYELLQGALVRDRSRVLATLLDKWTASRLAGTSGAVAGDERFAANVLARWLDGAGKLHYRHKEYTDARKMFEAALAWAERAGLWFLRPDLCSNLVRAGFEEERTVGKRPDQVSEYLRLLAETLDLAGEHGLADPLGSELPGDQAREDGGLPGGEGQRQAREFRRGLCSILHNLSLAEDEQDRFEDSLRHSRQSEALALAMGDSYRLAQAINHQARLMAKRAGVVADEEQRAKCVADAISLFARVRDELAWRRGRLIAWQESAKLEAIMSSTLQGLLAAIGKLRALLEEISGGDGLTSGHHGGDLEAYDYSVRALRSVADHLRSWEGDEPERARLEHEALARFVEDEELYVVRAVRQVVKVGHYKQSFSRDRAQVYERHVARHLGADGDLLQAMALTEEASGRELLDLLALGGVPRADIERPAFDWETAEAALVSGQGTAGSPPVAEGGEAERRHDMRRVAGAAAAARLDYLKRALRDYESEARASPIAVTPHDPKISQKILDMSRRHPGFAMIRYTSLRQRPTGRRSVGAFALRCGKLDFKDLESEGVRELLGGARTVDGEGRGPLRHVDVEVLGPAASALRPDARQARALWDTLIAPVWETIAPSGLDLPSHLVLVPHGDLFEAPLHLALEGDGALPLSARVPLSFSVSATMHIAARRYRKRWLRPTLQDALCAISALDPPRVSGEELCDTGWESERLHVLGDEPQCLHGHQYLGRVSWEGLDRIKSLRPEFLVVACHGSYDPQVDRADLGPTLDFGSEIPFVSQFDIARRLDLPRNELTVLAACVSGQGAGLEGGDVAGFVRSFIAAGAGALAVTLFGVRDDEVVLTVRHLLQATRDAIGASSVDLVGTLQSFYNWRCTGIEDVDRRLEACPLVIYL